MFDFWKFHNGLADRRDYFDNYWDKFPKGRLLRFKGETLSLLKKNLSDKDAQGLFCTLAVILNDGANRGAAGAESTTTESDRIYKEIMGN